MESVKFKSYIMRMAEKEDVPRIIKYLKREWNPQHIFVKHPEFFEYEYCNGTSVNGILAENLENGEIDGILLMYPVGDKVVDVDFFGGIWSVSRECKMPMLGLKMVESVLKITGARSHSGVGINPKTTAKIFRYVKGQKVGKLKHYYRLSNKDKYVVAHVETKRITEVKSGKARFIEFHSIEELNAEFQLSNYKEMPYYKDSNYIERRYFKHPAYNYNIVGIVINNRVEGIIIFRKIEYRGVRIARVIDFFGDDYVLKESGLAFQKMLENEMLEYIDFYEYGLDDTALVEAGFIIRREEDDNIIPNYFEPYLQKNIELWFHTPYEKCRIFKGDGDQDRPNCIN